MRTAISMTLAKDVISGLAKLSRQEGGLTVSQYVAIILGQVVQAQDDEDPLVIWVKKADRETFKDMHLDMGGAPEHWTLDRESLWLSAATQTAAAAHRDRQTKAGSRYFLGGWKGEGDGVA